MSEDTRPLLDHFQRHQYSEAQLHELVIQEVRTRLEADWQGRGSWVADYLEWPDLEAQPDTDPDSIEPLEYATAALLMGCEEILETPIEPTTDLTRLEELLAGMTRVQLEALIVWASDLLHEFYAGLGSAPGNGIGEEEDHPVDHWFLQDWKRRTSLWK